MRPLPERPNLDQLRRRAKELHRAAAAGDLTAGRRLRRVSTSTRLAAAQLALAREYGFPSWARLKAEVARRAASSQSPARSAPPELRTWQGMRDWMASLLQRRTGQDVEAWSRRIKAARVRDEAALRRWLDDKGVTGYAQRHPVWLTLPEDPAAAPIGWLTRPTRRTPELPGRAIGPSHDSRARPSIQRM